MKVQPMQAQRIFRQTRRAFWSFPIRRGEQQACILFTHSLLGLSLPPPATASRCRCPTPARLATTHKRTHTRTHALFTRPCPRTTIATRTRAAMLRVPRGAPASPPHQYHARPHSRRRLVHAGAWLGSVFRSCFQIHIWPAMCNRDGSLPSSSRRRLEATHAEESSATRQAFPVHTRILLSWTILLPHGTHVQVLPA